MPTPEMQKDGYLGSNEALLNHMIKCEGNHDYNTSERLVV